METKNYSLEEQVDMLNGYLVNVYVRLEECPPRPYSSAHHKDIAIYRIKDNSFIRYYKVGLTDWDAYSQITLLLEDFTFSEMGLDR